ncbi:MAG: UDP-N-acetylmuramate dehydrogenase [Microbacteriaceae bacterium]|nr:UDP-N-acetylmuramate dehydrogenase [Microbacteriaceae bacterium]
MLLSELTTLHVGGSAGTLLSPSTPDELVDAVREAWLDDNWLVLGGGSNIVIGDEGFDGTVIRVLTRGISQQGSRLTVQAGEPWDAVVAYAVDHGLAGIEALSGIPGSAGAAPIQNIGAYGQEVGDVLVAIDFVDAETGERARLTREDLELGYRTSTLKQYRRGLVVSVELELTESSLSADITYAQLAATLGERAPLVEVRAAVLALRASKGMLLDRDDPDSTSAGSFFTNPIVSDTFARSLPADVARWPADEDSGDNSSVKLSAAWLIEHAGISKGFALPGSRAAISSKHSLAITNTGGATAEQVAELARYVQTRVLTAYGVILQPEPILVGVSL